MQKKKYNLTSSLIELDTKQTNNTKSKYILLTLSVDENFRYKFKNWCTKHKMKMNEALVHSFELLKEKYGP